MESLTTAGEILTQLKIFTDGMALICQDVDTLKQVSMPQGDNSMDSGVEAVGGSSELVPPPPTPSEDDAGLSYLPSPRIEGITWAEEMDSLEETSQGPTTPVVQVVPVSEWTNKFLNEAFYTEKSSADHKKLRSQYTLLQNELTKTPFLDTMMASQCSSSTKSLDKTLSSLQGRVLEAVGPLSQLLECINSEETLPSMDQIGDAVEAALTLLALHISGIRRTKILEDYKELVSFAATEEHDWTSGAPQLFGPNFLREASDYSSYSCLEKLKRSRFFSSPPPPPSRAISRGAGSRNKQL